METTYSGVVSNESDQMTYTIHNMLHWIDGELNKNSKTMLINRTDC